MLGRYDNFFIASSGASAAILGLLFVAVTVANTDESDLKTRERRTVLAGSAFLALVDAFFVSMLALTGGAGVFGVACVVMAIVGLLGTSRLIPRAWRAGNFSRGFPTQRLNIIFASVSAGGFSIQLVLAAILLADDRSAALQRALVVLVVCLYGSALGRAWEVMGIGRRRYALAAEDPALAAEDPAPAAEDPALAAEDPPPGVALVSSEAAQQAPPAHAGAERPEIG